MFQEFVETFQEAPINGSSKVWVKAGTYDAGARSKSIVIVCVFLILLFVCLFVEEDTRERGKLYKPQSRLSSSQDSSTSDKAQAYARLLSSDRKPERLGKRKQPVKSNLESFKEELRQYA